MNARDSAYELLYTGITRAKSGVEVWGSDEIIGYSICTRVERMSGLDDMVYSL